MKDLPPHVILGANSNAIEGGIRLWQEVEELKAPTERKRRATTRKQR
jgi:polyphosphate glucokinase